MRPVSKVVRVKLLDIAPKFRDFGPSEMLAISGILTIKSASFQAMLKSLNKSLVKKFHREATARGHASLLTSPNVYFWLEGSRILDFYFTSFPFGSYIMLSSRRFGISFKNIVIPDSILESKFSEKYEKICREMVRFYAEEMKKVGKDKARKILPIGFVSRGFFNFPLQLLIGSLKEAENENFPREIQLMLAKMERKMKKIGEIYEAAKSLPYNTTYPHPNLFSEKKLKVRKFRLKILNKEKFKLPKIKILPEAKKIMENCKLWKGFVDSVENKLTVKVEARVSLAAWNEIKRHRTVRQDVESIYDAAEDCLKNKRLIHVPKGINKKRFLEICSEALSLYEEMVENGIEKRDAIYILPHSITLGINLILNGYHIFDPFGFLGVRSCSTADYELNELSQKIIDEICKRISGIKKLLGPKCKIGFCPERIFCANIFRFVKNYNLELHKKLQAELLQI